MFQAVTELRNLRLYVGLHRSQYNAARDRQFLDPADYDREWIPLFETEEEAIERAR